VAEDLRLVEVGVRCSLEQMLEEGFYHAGVWRGVTLACCGVLACVAAGLRTQPAAAAAPAGRSVLPPPPRVLPPPRTRRAHTPRPAPRQPDEDA
jgi:hypothetical protein